MADSNITKRALAAAIKELMKEKTFDKISVGDICEKCDMNRKSFYYHFKDKYDLVNWIFDIEFVTFVNEREYHTSWEFMQDLCCYFYTNKEFYRKALQIKGQNSFSEHFREYLQPILSAHLKPIFEDEEQGAIEFYVAFFCDAYISAIERWILDKDCVPPEELVRLLHSCVIGITQKVSQDMQLNDAYPG